MSNKRFLVHVYTEGYGRTRAEPVLNKHTQRFTDRDLLHLQWWKVSKKYKQKVQI